jgi:hypothetical protein
MNNRIDSSSSRIIEHSISNGIDVSSRTVWQWCFSQPPLGKSPSVVHPQIISRLNGQPSATTRVLMVRSNNYFESGCPLDLCDYAAARDLWNALHNVQ